MFALANMIDRSRFTPVLAWHPRYNRLLGDINDEFYPLHSITTEQFVERLRTAKPVYDLRTMEVYVAWEQEVFRESRPDAVVGDFRLSLATSSKIAGIPYVNVVNAHWSPFARPRFTVPDCPPSRIFGPAFAQLVFNVARPFFFLSYANDFNRLAQKFGRPSFGYDLRKIYCEGDRTLYPDLPEITPTFELPASHRYLGPVPWSLSEMPVRVIAATGGKTVLRSPPPNIHVVDFVAGDAACERADLVVFNGGVGGTHQAVMAGTPVVGIPSNLDQFLNMYFVEQAGFGRTVRADGASEKRIARAIETVIWDDSYRERAQVLGERARSHEPAAILNEVLEGLFEGRTPKSWPTPHQAVRSDIDAVSYSPSVELVRDVVQAGILAPSAANCQPWRFSWNDATLEVCLVPDRAYPFLHVVNPDLAVSLGAVLTNMGVAAAAQKHRIEVELFPESGRDGLMARVWFVIDETADASLVDTLAERVTNRRSYENRPIPAQIRDELLATADRERPTVQIHWIEEEAHRNTLADAMAVFYQVLFANPTIHLAFMEWLRWTPEAESEHGTGLSIPSLELGRVPRMLFRLASSHRRARLLTPTGLFRMFRAANSRHMRRSAAIGLITVPDYDAAQLVRAGQVFETLWLEATRRGLALHPIGGLPFLALQSRYAAGAGLSSRQQRISERAIFSATKVIPAFSERMPAIMFRTGYAPPPSARSIRLPIDELFEAI
jgi:UDP:flavonoid glycosyltransferase YjiC (YdhE family)